MNSILPAYFGGSIDDRRFGKGLTEDEAISVGIDFGVTQVVDANWGVHAIIKKAMFGRSAMAQFVR